MSAPRFTAEVHDVDDAVVIVLTGDVNALAEEDFDRAVTQALAVADDTVLLDFTDTAYINSTGIALIVGLLRRARAARIRVVAYGLNEHYREIFAITQLTDYMPIADDQASARKSATTFVSRGSRNA
jgi:anti-anti-sigma factor